MFNNTTNIGRLYVLITLFNLPIKNIKISTKQGRKQKISKKHRNTYVFKFVIGYMLNCHGNRHTRN